MICVGSEIARGKAKCRSKGRWDQPNIALEQSAEVNGERLSEVRMTLLVMVDSARLLNIHVGLTPKSDRKLKICSLSDGFVGKTKKSSRGIRTDRT
jgi:hypothetical protein